MSTPWVEITKRNARSVQTVVGWIFWDPGAVARHKELGLEGPLGYIAARCAPLACAGPEAVNAAFGSISSIGIALVFDALESPDDCWKFWHARDAAILEGLAQHAPEILDPLADQAADLWGVVEQLPVLGRTFFGSLLGAPRPVDPVLSGWHAINCLREWRGDTHWALVVAAGLTHPEASILHNAWLGYEADWLPISRGSTRAEIDAGWEALRQKGLAQGNEVLPHGAELRQRLEDQTDALTTLPWELFGESRSRAFAETYEPPCVKLLQRVDITAGPNYQPGSRVR